MYMKVEKHLLNDLKPLNQSEKVVDILDAMEELKFSHLPVVDDERLYLGVICEDDLLEVSNEDDILTKHLRLLKAYRVSSDADMFEAIRIIGEGNLSLLPVVDAKNHYRGYIATSELLQDVGRELTFKEPGGVLVLSIPVRDYQLTQIAQIVESEDAKVIGFHLSEDTEQEKLLVALKINQTDLDRIVKSFQRYNYNVVEVFHQSLFDDSLEDRYQSFMKYLNI
ncbi:CBS domain-containing protein [Owenweeksia hongkongensis]|uniref:CBS domain-containing protein n=1 Tax=Owenweeksia hongkongensis TaxID=253245 RepID=UPI003A901959